VSAIVEERRKYSGAEGFYVRTGNGTVSVEMPDEAA